MAAVAEQEKHDITLAQSMASKFHDMSDSDDEPEPLNESKVSTTSMKHDILPITKQDSKNYEIYVVKSNNNSSNREDSTVTSISNRYSTDIGNSSSHDKIVSNNSLNKDCSPLLESKSNPIKKSSYPNSSQRDEINSPQKNTSQKCDNLLPRSVSDSIFNTSTSPTSSTIKQSSSTSRSSSDTSKKSLGNNSSSIKKLSSDTSKSPLSRTNMQSSIKLNPITKKQLSNSNSSPASSSTQPDLPLCKFGADCYRKNPIHFREFRHVPNKKEDSISSTKSMKRSCLDYPTTSSNKDWLSGPEQKKAKTDDIETTSIQTTDAKTGKYI